MIDINKLFETKVKFGTIVVPIRNHTQHEYEIGKKYKVAQVTSVPDAYGNTQDSNSQFILMDMDTEMVGYSTISLHEISLSKAVNKKEAISNLENILEFLKDYEGEINNDQINKEYKVYNILKEVKSSNSDFDKIKIISEII